MAEGVIDGMTSSTVTTTSASLGFGDVLVDGLASGFKTIVNVFFTKGVILSALFFFLDFCITFFLDLLASILNISDLTDMLSQIPFTDFLKYLLYLGAFDYGMPMLLSAYCLCFLIRRLPIVG